MTEQPAGAGVAGAALTPEQSAYLTAAAAQQAAAESAPVVAQAADTASQMTERGPLLPAESQMDALMAALKAQSDQIAALTKQVGVMQAQAETAQAASGGPLTVRYAQGAVDKLQAHAAAWPVHDLSVASSAATDLLNAAQAIVKGNPSAADRLAAAQAAISRVTSKLPHIDVSAVLDDVTLAVEEGLKLAALA